MSSSKLDTSGFFQSVPVTGQKTCLTLPANSVRIRKNGIEFHSRNSMSMWKEMTVVLEAPGENRKVHCTAVVVASEGNRHEGYRVSMVFVNLSRQSQERLNGLTYSRWA